MANPSPDQRPPEKKKYSTVQILIMAFLSAIVCGIGVIALFFGFLYLVCGKH